MDELGENILFFGKLSVPILIFLIGVLQIILTLIWHDKRTTKHRKGRIAIILSMIILAFIAFTNVIGDHQAQKDAKEQAKYDVKEAEKREQKAKQERADIQITLDELWVQLEPFKKIAIREYNTVGHDSALLLLAKSFDAKIDEAATRLENITREVSTQEIYRPLSKIIMENVITSLRKLKQQSTSTITHLSIKCKEGNRDRVLLAGDLQQLLLSAGYTTNLGYYSVWGKADDHAIVITCHKENEDYLNKFLIALRPFIATDDGWVYTPENFGKDSLKIDIQGAPIFRKDGSVSLR